jgi:hypothetical protein
MKNIRYNTVVTAPLLRLATFSGCMAAIIIVPQLAG